MSKESTEQLFVYSALGYHAPARVLAGYDALIVIDIH